MAIRGRPRLPASRQLCRAQQSERLLAMVTTPCRVLTSAPMPLAAIYQEIIVDCVNGGADNVSNMQLVLVRRASDLSLLCEHGSNRSSVTDLLGP